MSKSRSRMAVAALGALGCVPALAVASVSCALSTGQSVVTTRDLSALYPGAVARCQQLPDDGDRGRRLEAKLPHLVWSATGLAGQEQARVAMDALDFAPRRWDDEPQQRILSARTPPATIAALISDSAGRHGVDPHLVRAIVQVESAFRPDAISSKGAIGLMQIMPATGARYGVEQRSRLFDPATNIDAGTRYLRDLIAMFPGRKDLVVAAYNAGEGSVIRHGRTIPPFQETRGYVRMVMQVYASIAGAAARGVSTDANLLVR